MKTATRRKPEPVAEAPDKPAPTAMEGHVRHGHKTERKIQSITDELAGHLSRLHGEGSAAAAGSVPPTEPPSGGLDAELTAIETNVDKLLDRQAALVRKLSKHA